jgi:hypothetical protein
LPPCLGVPVARRFGDDTTFLTFGVFLRRQLLEARMPRITATRVTARITISIGRKQYGTGGATRVWIDILWPWPSSPVEVCL